jgi:putative membrane protein
MRKTLSVLLVPAALLFAQSLPAFAQQSQSPNAPQGPPWYGPGPWHMWADGYGWHFWWFGPMMMMLFMVLICVAVLYFIFGRHSLSGGPPHWGPGHMMDRNQSYSALQILDERYARGEIQKEEYEERKATILSGRPR